MRGVALIPAVALVVGVLCGTQWPHGFSSAVPVAVWACGCLTWWRQLDRATTALLLIGFLLSGVVLGAAASRDVLAPPLRLLLDRHVGGFALDAIGPGGAHSPMLVRGRLVEDAAVRDGFTSLRLEVETVHVGGVPVASAGGLQVSVNGAPHAADSQTWRAGRTLEVPVTFRRPARYLNDGVGDFERDLALSGIVLAGSVKSALIVDVVAAGTWFDEAAGSARAHVRRRVGKYVGRDTVREGIVTAILIGDRTGLPDEVRERLQAAGTYHVIAISGGNVALLAALMLALMSLAGLAPRQAAAVAAIGLSAYAAAVTAGPSVWRATLTAVVYLSARAIDHRSPPWHAMAVSAAILACISPLDVRNVGFVLTFGAAGAILEAARRVQGVVRLPRPLTWLLAAVAASAAVELALLPVSAAAFSRVTTAGLLLNLAAVPLMTVTQMAGIVVATAPAAFAAPAGWIADRAAGGLLETARLVDIAPWLSWRVPPPPALLLVGYYSALGVWVLTRRPEVRRIAAIAVTSGLTLIAAGAQPAPGGERAGLRLTVFDVGQGDAMLLQMPDASAMVVDTGGIGFGASAFDIGGRVLAPALWARGLRRLDLLALTHGHPDHVGGALRLVRDFSPREIWEGVRVAGDPVLGTIQQAAQRQQLRLEPRYTGAARRFGEVQVRILSPAPPDWERRRVRNADSLVMEVVYRDAAILLTGDIEAEQERRIAPLLRPARIRILKVAHHGSRTSTSPELIDSWRPTHAVISCGRGNTFGHPHPDVLARLEAAGTKVLRTDLQGQITFNTDGHRLSIDTYVGKQK